MKRPLLTVCAIVLAVGWYRYAVDDYTSHLVTGQSTEAKEPQVALYEEEASHSQHKEVSLAVLSSKPEEVPVIASCLQPEELLAVVSHAQPEELFVAISHSHPQPQPIEEKTRRVNPYPIPKRIDVGHIEGKGIGYDVGYTQMAIVFGPEYRLGHGIALLDLRGVIFDDGKLAANVGMIGRFLPQHFCEVFGANIFYDFREGKQGNFNQISGGFEMLHRRWELHMSARIPVGVTKHTKKRVSDRQVCKSHQFALSFFDADVGYYLVKSKNFQLYAAAGPYYLSGPFRSGSFGGKAWLRPQFTDYFAVELSVSHDDIYETIYQVNAIFSLPLYKFSSALNHKTGPCRITNRQIYQPIDRDVVLRKKKHCRDNF